MQWIYDRKFITGNLVALACMGLVLIFPPAQGVWGSIVVMSAFLLVLPVLFIRFIVRERVAGYGFAWGKWKSVMFWTILPFILFNALFGCIFYYADVFPNFSVPVIVRTSFRWFLAYVAIMGTYLFLYQAFFCGFILGLWRKVGMWQAVAVQTLLFTVFLTIRSWPGEMTGILVIYITSGILSGTATYRTKSIFPAFLFSYLSAILAIVASLVFS